MIRFNISAVTWSLGSVGGGSLHSFIYAGTERITWSAARTKSMSSSVSPHFRRSPLDGGARASHPRFARSPVHMKDPVGRRASSQHFNCRSICLFYFLFFLHWSQSLNRRCTHASVGVFVGPPVGWRQLVCKCLWWHKEGCWNCESLRSTKIHKKLFYIQVPAVIKLDVELASFHLFTSSLLRSF